MKISVSISMNPSDVSGFVLTNLCLLSQFSPRLHRQVSIFYCFHTIWDAPPRALLLLTNQGSCAIGGIAIIVTWGLCVELWAKIWVPTARPDLWCRGLACQTCRVILLQLWNQSFNMTLQRSQLVLAELLTLSCSRRRVTNARLIKELKQRI